MSPAVFAYAAPADWPATGDALHDAVDLIRSQLSPDAPRIVTQAVTVLDSTNRRLTRRGYLLTRAAGPAAETWTLSGPEGETVAREQMPDAAARFDGELPNGALRALLEDLSRGRSLHTLAALQETETTVALRDGRGKVRCRLKVNRVTNPDGMTTADFSVLALKGYGDDADRIRTRFEDALGWPLADEPALARLLRLSIPVPGCVEGEIRGDDPAGPVMREILSAQLDVLEDRLPGVLEDRHPDYLHQFRVAIRRTRSALSQLPEAIALEGRTDAVESFRWLGQITGPQRDLDVLLLDLSDRMAASGDADTLAPLHRHLTRLKTAAHRDLVRLLSGPRFHTSVARWRDSLSPSSANWTTTEPLRAPFTEVVSARGAKLLRRVLRDGRGISPESPAERLHDLRKRMKKLRYVCEFLAEVLPREHTKPAIKALKGLQEVLGRVQDREVQVDALHRHGRDLAARKDIPADTLMAIGAWSEELDRDRRDARAEFAAAFGVFSTAETLALFHRLFDGHTAHPGEGRSHRKRPKED